MTENFGPSRKKEVTMKPKKGKSRRRYLSVSLALFFAVLMGGICLLAPLPGAAMPVPEGASIISSYAPVATPLIAASPHSALPISVGNVATGGNTIRLSVGLEDFPAPVDAYFGIYAPGIDPINVYLVTGDGVQTLASGLVPWKSGVTRINDGILGDIPILALPQGDYTFVLLIVPAGAPEPTLGSDFYLWQTTLSISRMNVATGSLLQNVEVLANQVNELRFTYDIPEIFLPLKGLSVDTAATLEFLTISPLGDSRSLGAANSEDSLGTPTVVTVRIGSSTEIDTVCETGVLYGPFSGRGATVTPREVSATQETLNVINIGSISVCVRIVPTSNVVFSLENLALV